MTGEYLQKSNWPDCIPPTEPTQEYAPQAWWQPTHHDPHDVDAYQHTHPAAASIGYEYLGDVCPYCGVPLSWEEHVVLLDGRRGVLGELCEVDEVVPAYHPDCWRYRQADILVGDENASFDDFFGPEVSEP